MAPLRLALPDSLRSAVEAAAIGRETPPWELISPQLPAEERQRQRWARIWLERRRASGASEPEALSAMQNASVRTLLAVLDRRAEAALLDEAQAAAARRLLEPRRGTVCADLWIGEAPGGGVFGWWQPESSDAVAPAAGQMQAAVEELQTLAGQPARAVVASFSGGPDPQARASDRLAATLAARVSASAVALYSPLLYRDGALQVGELLAAVRQQSGAAAPVLCLSRLRRAEFATALLAAGGSWAGPLRAGAEIPAASLSANAAPAHVAATCRWLLCATTATRA